MSKLGTPLISREVALEIHSELIKAKGVPAPNKVIVLHNKSEQKTAAGIIIPQGDLEDVAKKGVIVQIGPISDEDDLTSRVFANTLEIGDRVTFGDYAGKKIELESNIEMLDRNTSWYLTVLSLTEIIYIEK